MAITHRAERTGQSSDSSSLDKEYAIDTVEKGPVHSTAVVESADEGAHGGLHRGLKARHITMIAIGGAIGTGLIIGTCVARRLWP